MADEEKKEEEKPEVTAANVQNKMEASAKMANVITLLLNASKIEFSPEVILALGMIYAATAKAAGASLANFISVSMDLFENVNAKAFTPVEDKPESKIIIDS